MLARLALDGLARGLRRELTNEPIFRNGCESGILLFYVRLALLPLTGRRVDALLDGLEPVASLVARLVEIKDAIPCDLSSGRVGAARKTRLQDVCLDALVGHPNTKTGDERIHDLISLALWGGLQGLQLFWA